MTSVVKQDEALASSAVDSGNGEYWQKKQELEKKGKKLFSQTIYRHWCKSCGICVALCPKDVYTRNETGGPEIIKPDECIGCLSCEIHCPDFAISITPRYPDRRRGQRDKDGRK